MKCFEIRTRATQIQTTPSLHSRCSTRSSSSSLDSSFNGGCECQTSQAVKSKVNTRSSISQKAASVKPPTTRGKLIKD